MECLYNDNFDFNSTQINIIGDELKHLKALRLKLGDTVFVSNGNGLVVLAKIIDVEKNRNILLVTDYYKNHNEPKHKKYLVASILDSKDRYEFLLEKSVELGVTDFIPLLSQRVQKTTINLNRLQSKAISAMKQCRRANKILIYNPIKCNDIINLTDNIDDVILLDMKENTDKKSIKGSSMFIVGPEGGFTDIELNNLIKMKNIQKWYLGKRRLRTETAAIMALSIGGYING